MNSRGEPASEFRRRLAFLLIGALGVASGCLPCPPAIIYLVIFVIY
jgi:hypothetical protein